MNPIFTKTKAFATVTTVSGLIFATSSFVGSAAEPAAHPLHILYVGDVKVSGSGTNYAFLPGQRLAPEAIYFDYRADVTCLTPAYLRHFDAVLLGPDAQPQPEQKAALNAFKNGNGVKQLTAAPTADDALLRADVLALAGEKARAEWQAFVAGRAPLRYEKRSDIPNYEQREEPLQYQFPLPASESMKYVQVPADFDLKLFVGEPDIVRPIAMAWDERGRLWVAEARDYPHGLRENGEGHDDIKICEDTDGDGRADKFTIFADKLSIPTSFTFADGGIVVAQAPDFLFLKDTDSDDHADIRQVIFKNSWRTNDTHAGPSSLHWGFDNWLYGTVGYAGFHGIVGGKMQDFRQGIYRFRPDGSAIEFLFQFSNNTWGFGQNAEGDLFGSTANNAPSFYGTIPYTHLPAGQRMITAKRINAFDRVHPNTPNIRQVDVIGGFTAAAGHQFMNSGELPARLQDKALVCEPTCKLITIFDVQRDGAGYVSRDGFNLLASSDEWMSPMFAEVGPDGAVWVADWYNFIIQHNPTPSPERGGYRAETGAGGAHFNPNRDDKHGRIYRVVWKDAKPAPIQSLANARTPVLVKALDSDNEFWRLTAQRLLVDGKKVEAAAALKTMVTNSDAIGAIHALWTLNGLGALDRDTHQAALISKEGAVRRNAVRALGHDEAAQQLFFRSGVINDSDLITRFAAFIKLSEFATSPDIQTVVGLLRRQSVNTKDEFLSEALALLGKVHQVHNYTEGPNLLPNHGFEVARADGLPEGWEETGVPDALKPRVVSGAEAHSGEHALRFNKLNQGEPDEVLAMHVSVKPNTSYRLAGWIKSDLSRGGVRLALADPMAQTKPVDGRSGDWVLAETIFETGDRTNIIVQCLITSKAGGTVWLDDLSLTEVSYESEKQVLAGDIKRGEQIFLTSPVAGCVQCHTVHGKGGAIGPVLDGIGSRKDEAYLMESLLDPSAKIAEGFNFVVSPMPPMGLVLKDQELADVMAFLLSLKAE